MLSSLTFGATRKPPATVPPQPVAQPTPTPAPRPALPPAAPVSIVTVNGQTFTTAELEPAVRQELEQLDAKIAEARRNVLELQINTMLLEVEARKRRIDTHRLYELEVSSRVPAATPAQIKKCSQPGGGLSAKRITRAFGERLVRPPAQKCGRTLAYHRTTSAGAERQCR